MSDDDYPDDDAVMFNDSPELPVAMISKDLLTDTSLSPEARFVMVWIEAFEGSDLSAERLGMPEEAYTSGLEELVKRGLVMKANKH